MRASGGCEREGEQKKKKRKKMVDVQTIEAGDGCTYPKEGQILTVHYRGLLDDGFEFDSTEGKEPLQFKFGVGQVIMGWDEGFARLSLGEKAMLFVESDFAYGEEGSGKGLIPPDADLRFEVHLLAIEDDDGTFGVPERPWF
eukprot:TRINITY_DN2470_c0_g1_i1.p1 TRINITY_DN2470_c0_g1~~TRINITY_DN2470_c0_g1_i1.p1  ORF type:complete len:142 (-),score=54.98 TRINITY_DN2470_c0_g1_i1:371-796(-)